MLKHDNTSRPPPTRDAEPPRSSVWRVAPQRGGVRLVAMIAAVAMSVSLAPLNVSAAPKTAADPGAGQLVRNHDFAAGTKGWRTNSSTQRLQKIAGPSMRLSSTNTSGVVLNDVTNTVRQSPKGQTYTVKARIKTTTPSVSGAVRVREVGPKNVETHRKSFHLTNKSWETVTFNFTTKQSRASLDLNVLAWEIPKGDSLIIDYVSMKSTETREAAPKASATKTSQAAPKANNNTCKGTPSRRTVFGTSLDVTDPTPAKSLAKADSAFGRIPIVRDFNPGMPQAWNSSKSKALRNRQVVVSFAAHPNAITSGRYDKYLKKWFATAPRDQTIYWSYMHEPEVKIKKGQFTAAQFRAAWRHIDKLADQACKPKMYSTLILTQWTFNPLSGRNWHDYDTGKNVIDVLAFDPYNEWRDPARTRYVSVDKLLSPIAKAMRADGRPWGIAELGSTVMRGDNGKKRAAWLTEVGAFLKKNDASFATYFHTTYAGYDMRIDDSYSRRAWANLVNG